MLTPDLRAQRPKVRSVELISTVHLFYAKISQMSMLNHRLHRNPVPRNRVPNIEKEKTPRMRCFFLVIHSSVRSDGRWSHWAELNRRPLLYESIALPTELQWQFFQIQQFAVSLCSVALTVQLVRFRLTRTAPSSSSEFGRIATKSSICVEIL